MAGTVVASTINNDTGLFATNNAYLGIAKAWVQFGYISSAIVVAGSFNVSSVTRTGTGSYTVTFTTAMPNTNYSVATGGDNYGINNIGIATSTQRGSTASICNLQTFATSSNAATDATYVCVSVFSS